VLQAVLAAGYRPRHIAAEFNRVLPPYEALVIPYIADNWERLGHSCRFGGSMLAFRRLFEAFGYAMGAQDRGRVNLYTVQVAETGGVPPLSYDEACAFTRLVQHFARLGAPCLRWHGHLPLSSSVCTGDVNCSLHIHVP
jgi:hypothetical protein